MYLHLHTYGVNVLVYNQFEENVEKNAGPTSPCRKRLIIVRNCTSCFETAPCVIEGYLSEFNELRRDIK